MSAMNYGTRDWWKRRRKIGGSKKRNTAERRWSTKGLGGGWQRSWPFWIQKQEDEDKETEEIGERWDRLGPYTESDGEMVKVLIAEEEKEEELHQPSTPVRGRQKRRRGGRLTSRRRKKVKVESFPEEEKEEKVCSAFGCKLYRIIVHVLC